MYRLGKRAQGGDNLSDNEIYTFARELLNISNDEHKQVYEEVKAHKVGVMIVEWQISILSSLDIKSHFSQQLKLIIRAF